MENIEAAPAPAEQSPVVESEAAEPKETEQQETPKNETAEEKPSRRKSLEKAFAKLDKEAGQEGQDTDVKAEKKAEKVSETSDKKTEKASETQSETKKAPEKPEADAKSDASKVAQKPPARFSEEAKKAWEQAPEAVRAETLRAIKENEQGLAQYKKQLEPIQPFMKMAGNDISKLAGAMGRYVNTENILRQDPARGFTEIARNMGLSPQQVGKMLLGQDPGKSDPRDRQLMQMHQELQQLRQQTGQVTQDIQQQRMQGVSAQVEQFAQQNPRFEELASDIAEMLTTGYAKDLQDAYEKAERLKPAPPTPEPPAETAKASAQTRPTRSVTGAPTTGSNPAHRKPSASRSEAIMRGFSKAGF